MRTINATRPWPPDAAEELKSLLSNHQYPDRENADRHPDLKVALDELHAWINDPRPYKPLHKYSWQSLIEDLNTALRMRGQLLTVAAPALDDLQTALNNPAIREGEPAQRASCLPHLELAREQLQNEETAVAAFDDVFTAVSSPLSSTTTIRHRMQVLTATLHAAERSLKVEGYTLAGVLDDAAHVITPIRHHLDGTPVPEGGHHWDDTSGLSVSDRLELCRRLLRKPPNPGSQVVWLAYGNARIRTGWKIPFGPVTFFDGPELLSSLNSAAEGPHPEPGRSLSELPQELLADEDSASSKFRVWPTDEHWVAVRVELERDRPYADPVAAARDQADALVKLASFQSGGTSWKPYTGHRHFLDGSFRSGTYPIGPDLDDVGNDQTDAHLEALQPHLANHVPVRDPTLHELLEATNVLGTSDSEDPTSLLHAVRIIELLATRCGTGTWQRHLQSTFAVDGARRHVLHELYSSVADALDNRDFRIVDAPNVPRKEDLWPVDPGTNRHRVRYDACHAALSELAATLPDHHRISRRIKTVQRKTKDPAAVSQWITELKAEHQQLVSRLARCRNSLAHGGPLDLRVASTVRHFADDRAKLTTWVGLRATVTGGSVKVAHQEYQAMNDGWHAALQSVASVNEALRSAATVNEAVMPATAAPSEAETGRVHEST